MNYLKNFRTDVVSRERALRCVIGGALIVILAYVVVPVLRANNHQSPSRDNLQIGAARGELIEFRQFRDHLVVADFRFSDPTGCAQFFTHLGLSDNDPIINQGTPGLFLLIWHYDLCTGEDLLYVETRVPVPASDLSIDPNLRSARLNTRIPVCDFASGNCFELSINVTCTADGPMQTNPLHVQNVLPGITVSSLLWNSFWRAGQVSGSVSNGSADFTYGASASSFAVITKTIRGFMVVQIERP